MEGLIFGLTVALGAAVYFMLRTANELKESVDEVIYRTNNLVTLMGITERNLTDLALQVAELHDILDDEIEEEKDCEEDE